MQEALKAEIRTDLAELTALDGVSGHEQVVVRSLRDRFAPLADSVEVDAFGNLYARSAGKDDGYHLMLSAHSDEIGMMVKSVGRDGFLRFEIVAGVQPGLLAGRLVRVSGSVLGIVGVKSGHLQSARERSRQPEAMSLYIDVGASSAKAIAALGIRVGDPIAFVSPLVELNHPDIVAGKAIDNRLGCAVLLAVMRRLGQAEHRTSLTCAITTQEEVGMRGASAAAYTTQPDCAVVVDTAMSGDTPDVDFEREVPFGIGRGPVLFLASGSGIGGHLVHPAVRRLLEQAAEQAGVPYQSAAVLVGRAFTDAGTIHLARGGIPTAAIGLARRYSHSPVCTCNLNDAAGAVLWLLSFASLLDDRPSLSFL